MVLTSHSMEDVDGNGGTYELSELILSSNKTRQKPSAFGPYLNQTIPAMWRNRATQGKMFALWT